MSINRGRCSICDCEIIKKDHLGNFSLLQPNYRNIEIVTQKKIGDKILNSIMPIPCCEQCSKDKLDANAVFQKYCQIKNPDANRITLLGFKVIGFGKVKSVKNLSGK